MSYTEYQSEGDQSVDFEPGTDVAAGEPIEIGVGYWGVAANDVAADDVGSFRVAGVFLGKKTNPSNTFTVGEFVDFTPGEGFAAGTEWRVVESSTSIEDYVRVEINPPGASSGGGGPLLSRYKYSADAAARLALGDDITVTFQETSGLLYGQVKGSPGTWETVYNVATTDDLANLTEPEDGQYAIVESAESNLRFYIYKASGGGWIEQSGLAESTISKRFKSRADGEQPALNDVSYYPAGATPDYAGIDATMVAGDSYSIVQDNGSGIHVTSTYYHDGTSVNQISQPSSYHATTLPISGDASDYLDVTSIAAFDSATTSQQISVTIHDARKLVYGEDFTYSYVSASDKRIVWTDNVKNLLVIDERKVLIEYWD